MSLVVTWVHPVLFRIFGYDVMAFGCFLALAFATCYFVTLAEFDRHQVRGADLSSLALVAGVCGFFGAKLHYIAAHRNDVARPGPITPANFWEDGLIWQGGALCGGFGVALYLKFCAWLEEQDGNHSTGGSSTLAGTSSSSSGSNGEPRGGRKTSGGDLAASGVARVLDVAAPAVPLGHAIGKLGCFMSGDGCYGPPTTLPWGMIFPNGGLPTRHPVHPTPLYETASGLFVFFFLSLRRERALAFRYEQTSTMLILHSVCRFLVEFVRDHDHNGGQTPVLGNQQQLICLATMVFACWLRLSERLSTLTGCMVLPALGGLVSSAGFSLSGEGDTGAGVPKKTKAE